MKAQEWSQYFSHYKSIYRWGFFTDAKGQLTPQSEVGFSCNLNSYKLLWVCSLPAKMKKIPSKMKELEWSQHYISIFHMLKGS